MRLRHAAAAATLGLAAVSWVVTVRLMDGMDAGPATRLGPFAPFVAAWVAMTAAMMLPGAAAAVVRHADDGGGAGTVARFLASYLAVWTLVGVAGYVLYRPHGPAAAGALVIAAGVYELTPIKRRFRRRCGESVPSGFAYGLHCVGANIGLTLVLFAVGIMSVTWMCVLTVGCLAQRHLPARAAVDVPLALAIVGLGVLILLAPASVPGLTPPTTRPVDGTHHHRHH